MAPLVPLLLPLLVASLCGLLFAPRRLLAPVAAAAESFEIKGKVELCPSSRVYVGELTTVSNPPFHDFKPLGLFQDALCLTQTPPPLHPLRVEMHFPRELSSNVVDFRTDSRKQQQTFHVSVKNITLEIGMHGDEVEFSAPLSPKSVLANETVVVAIIAGSQIYFFEGEAVEGSLSIFSMKCAPEFMGSLSVTRSPEKPQTAQAPAQSAAEEPQTGNKKFPFVKILRSFGFSFELATTTTTTTTPAISQASSLGTEEVSSLTASTSETSRPTSTTHQREHTSEDADKTNRASHRRIQDGAAVAWILTVLLLLGVA